MHPETEQAVVRAAETGWVQDAFAFAAQNVWLSMGLAWVLVIVALTEVSKRVFDLAIDPNHPKRARVLQLMPFLFGVVTGPFLAPEIADTTLFASVGWIQGLMFGPVAGMGAIGAYELARETRPLRMLKVLIRGVFRYVYETIARKPLSSQDEEALDRTQKQPPLEP
jgi:hypothetical protein